jgi:hypothetical protein
MKNKNNETICVQQDYFYVANMQLWWSRGSVLAFGTQVRGFTPCRSRRIF